MKKRFSLFVVLMLTLSLVCGSIVTVNAASAKNTKVKLSESQVAMYVGETATITATATPKGSYKAAKWASSNKKVATVDANGVVTAVSEGTAKITFSVKNKKTKKVVKASANVFVGKEAPKYLFNLDDEADLALLGDNIKNTIFEEEVVFMGDNEFIFVELPNCFFKANVYNKTMEGCIALPGYKTAGGVKFIIDNNVQIDEFGHLPRFMDVKTATVVEGGTGAIICSDVKANLKINGKKFTKKNIKSYMNSENGQKIKKPKKINMIFAGQFWDDGKCYTKILGMK